MKPSPSDFCWSRNCVEWSNDQFTTSLSFGPKLAKSGQKGPWMTKIGLKVWKMTSETISIGFLLLLRSFWVVTWPVYNILEFKAKSGQKWPKKAPNDRHWPECVKSDIRNPLHCISAPLAVILSGHMTSLRQFWIWGQNWPKMAKKGPKWPKMAWMSEKWLKLIDLMLSQLLRTNFECLC